MKNCCKKKVEEFTETLFIEFGDNPLTLSKLARIKKEFLEENG